MSLTPFDAALAAYLSATPEERAGLDLVLNTEQAVYSKLLMIRAQGVTIPAAEYAAASQELGIGTRQIQRKLKALCADLPAPVRAPWALNEFQRKVIFAHQGNVSMAYRELYDGDPAAPSFSAFWRAWYEQTPMAIQEFARRGGDAMTNFFIYTPFTAPDRNLVWQADHFELPLDVITDGHTTTLLKPWLTLLVDDASRKVMGWSLTAEPNRRPDAETVLATLAAGMRVRLEDDVEVGGIPHIVRWDNDLSFTAGMITQLGTTLGFECHAVPPYSGHMKGKIERLGRRVQEQLVMLLPGFTHGPKTVRMRDPFRDTPPLTAAQLRGRLDLWFAEYDRTQDEGIRMTPLERWKLDADRVPLRHASDESLRQTLLVEPRRRKIIKRHGVHFRGQYWASAEMQKHVGKHVEVRYPIFGGDFIEIYRDAKWLCTAWPSDDLTETQKLALWEGRQDAYREARSLQDDAVELRQGAEALVGTTDATPSIASMPMVDPLAGDLDDLMALQDGAAYEGDFELDVDDAQDPDTGGAQ
jgi:putative transposase